MLEDRLRSLPLADAARPEFRAELAQSFASGRIASGEQVAPAPRTSPPREAARPNPRPLHSGPYPWQVGLGLLAAAAAVAVIVIGTRGADDAEKRPGDAAVAEGGLEWKVRSVGNELEVNDERIATANLANVAHCLGTAHLVECYEEGAELELADDLRLGMSPFTRLEFPDDEAQRQLTGASTRELEFVLDRGAVQLERKPGCGKTLVVSTPHAVVRIVGTVLDIEVVPGKGTCICVAEGSVEVLTRSGTTQMVVVGDQQTCFVFSDERAPAEGPTCDMAPPGHTAALEKFCGKQD